MNSPRWLGWILLIACVVNAVGWGFAIVVVAFFADEPWVDVAVDMLALCVLGVLAVVAGIRMLRGTSRQGTAIPG